MDLKDLNSTEQAALLALVRRCVLSDGALSQSEHDALEMLVKELGQEAYQAAAEEADERATDQSSLRALLTEVTNRDACELIYGVLLQVSTNETIDLDESRVLDLVEEVWGIRPQLEDFPDEDEEDLKPVKDVKDAKDAKGKAKTKAKA